MVHLLSTLKFNGDGLSGSLDEAAFKIEALYEATLVSDIFFNLCKACQVKGMASIPPSAFSAGRIRETQRDMKVSNVKSGRDPNAKIFNTNFMELSPLKYNSKLMNSIWGLYNRYSPHNVKNVNEGPVVNGELQQSAANSSSKTEPKISKQTTKLDNMWAALNVPQSH
ncbi:hypothetical protein MSG28_013252 [Choristoneura fumiferana]|uniref:Uncharacterized protein n=1 Tax=Choristoneura fumiferana TaxID=7141 RepID=A0ACC0KS90_CHOFU|nr:hypothetical protein MSG28_013252 [Choristoneura fumiferana]